MCLTYKCPNPLRSYTPFYVFEINKVLDFSLKVLDHFSMYTLDIFILSLDLFLGNLFVPNM